MPSKEFDEEELHPGVKVALQRHQMDELDVAKAIAAGDLTSPQKYGNAWLFALRITGTGASYREVLKEYVWRDPKLYMNEHFRERCYGLPVIVEHPDKMMLDTKEYRERNIGMVTYPYLKTNLDEVWGVARILDQPAAQYMREHDLSTSPAVVFKPSDGNVKEKLKDGKNHLLIEGKPSLLDHLAICEAGVWDKGGPPSGVDSTTGAKDKESKVTEEEMNAKIAAAEKERDDARKDAAEKGELLDTTLERLDRMDKRMDGLEVKDKDEEDKEDKRDDDDPEKEERQAAELHRLAEEEEEEAAEAEEASKDAARRDAGRKRYADAKARFDAAHSRLADAHKRLDDEGRKRHDAAKSRFDAAGEMLEGEEDRRDDEDELPWEEAERKEGESDRAHSRRVDDWAKRHDVGRLAKRSDESTAAHCDRVARDMRRDRARRDAEAAADAARKDAARANARADDLEKQVKETRSMMDDIRGRFEDRSDDDEAAFADAQSRADSVYGALGDHAPRPMRGETLVGYRARLARGLQSHSKAWKEEDLTKLSRHSPTAFAAAEAGIYADAVTASREPLATGPGLRKVIRKREGGGEMYDWVGDPLAWMGDFMPAEQFATRIGRE